MQPLLIFYYDLFTNYFAGSKDSVQSVKSDSTYIGSPWTDIQDDIHPVDAPSQLNTATNTVNVEEPCRRKRTSSENTTEMMDADDHNNTYNLRRKRTCNRSETEHHHHHHQQQPQQQQQVRISSKT